MLDLLLFLLFFVQDDKLNKLQYFFVTPDKNTPEYESNISVNINSEFFSSDSFLFYWNLIDSVYSKAMSHSQKWKDSELKHFQNQLGLNYNYLSFYYQRKEWNTVKAMDAYEKALYFLDSAGDDANKALAYNGMANIYQNQGNIQSAVDYYYKSLTIFDKIDDKHHKIITLTSLGELFLDFKDYNKAEEYCKLSLSLAKETKNNFHDPYAYMFLGAIRTEQNEFTQADDYFKKANMVAIDSSNRLQQALTYLYWGKNEGKKGNPEKANFYFQTGLELAKAINYENGISKLYLELSKLNAADNRINEALVIGNKSLDIALQTNIPSNVKNAAEWLSSLYETNGNDKLALHFYKLSRALHDSIYNQNNEKVIIRTQMKNEFDNRLLSHEVELKIQKKYKTILLVIGILLFAFSIGLIAQLFTLRQANDEIRRHKAITEQSIQEKDALLKEIHHRVKNNLEVISSLLHLQANAITNEQAKAALSEGQSRVQSIALIHHNLYRNDDMITVEINGFCQDLFKSVSEVFKKPDTNVICNINGDMLKVDKDVAVPLGLILNELLTNAFKYAMVDGNENTINITLEENAMSSGGMSKIIFRDNGPGMPANFNLNQSTSLGMKVIQILIKQIKGQLKMYNHHGNVVELIFKASVAK